MPKYMWLPLIYHCMEIPVAIICCCIPTLAPVIEKFKLSPFGAYFRNLFSRRLSKEPNAAENRNRDLARFGRGHGAEAAPDGCGHVDEVTFEFYEIGIKQTE